MSVASVKVDYQLDARAFFSLSPSYNTSHACSREIKRNRENAPRAGVRDGSVRTPRVDSHSLSLSLSSIKTRTRVYIYLYYRETFCVGAQQRASVKSRAAISCCYTAAEDVERGFFSISLTRRVDDCVYTTVSLAQYQLFGNYEA